MNVCFILKLTLLVFAFALADDDQTFEEECKQNDAFFCTINNKCYTNPAQAEQGRDEAQKTCKSIKIEGASVDLPQIEDDVEFTNVVTHCLGTNGNFSGIYFVKNEIACEAFIVVKSSYRGRTEFPLEKCNTPELNQVKYVCEVEENGLLEETVDWIEDIFN